MVSRRFSETKYFVIYCLPALHLCNFKLDRGLDHALTMAKLTIWEGRHDD
jgi:hypothetical protein